MILCPRCGQAWAVVDPACPQCRFAPAQIDGFLAWAPALSDAGGGFQADYFEPLVALEQGNFWFRSRNRLILWAIERYFPRFTSMLEIGCGTGYVLSGIAARFPAARLTASEVFAAGLKVAARRNPSVEFVQMDARAIPYRDEFDLAGAFDVLEHIEQDEQVLAQLHAALRPGGGLLLAVPQHPALWSAADDYAHHVRRYRAAELHAKLQRAGFRILRSTSFVSLLLPMMLASRRRSRTAEKFDPQAEFRIPPLLNRALESVLTLERTGIRAGIGWPVGGSRLVVARKAG